MPKSRRSASATIRACATMHRLVQAARHLGQRDVDRQRHHPQRRADQQHHRPAAAGELGQELGVAGKAEAGGVEGRLVDRVGDHGRRGPSAGQRHRPHDAGDDGGTRGRIGLPRRRLDRLPQRQHGQCVREHRRRLGRVGDLADGRTALAPQPVRVVQHQEGRPLPRQPPPGRDRDLAADAGGLAHGDRERRQVGGAAHGDQTASSTVTGTWSLGCSQPRAARSTSAVTRFGASSGDSQIWSSRRPRSEASQSCAR